jgi:citrate synthase
MKLREKLKSIYPQTRDDIARLVADHGDKVISDVTVAQAYGGMRGVKCMVCDTSVVNPEKGLILRGHPLAELTGCSPEEIFFLLLTGQRPSAEEIADLQQDLAARATVPEYVFETLRHQPKSSHPMAMFSLRCWRWRRVPSSGPATTKACARKTIGKPPWRTPWT